MAEVTVVQNPLVDRNNHKLMSDTANRRQADRRL